MALAAGPLGATWLFYVGLVLLLIALALPPRGDQTVRERVRNLVRHLPGGRWFGDRDG